MLCLGSFLVDRPKSLLESILIAVARHSPNLDVDMDFHTPEPCQSPWLIMPLIR